MNKSELVKAIADAMGSSVKDSQSFLETFLDVVTKSVAKGGTINITGFGAFFPRDRAARTARNPQTGAPVQVAATTVPVFRAGKKFKDAVKA